MLVQHMEHGHLLQPLLIVLIDVQFMLHILQTLPAVPPVLHHPAVLAVVHLLFRLPQAVQVAKVPAVLPLVVQVALVLAVLALHLRQHQNLSILKKIILNIFLSLTQARLA